MRVWRDGGCGGPRIRGWGVVVVVVVVVVVGVGMAGIALAGGRVTGP